MKTIYFVRHGESESNAGGLILGGEKTLLTKRGREQAGFVAKRCSKLPIDVIISSTMKRTMETAEIIATHINKPIEHSRLFVEWDRGSKRIGKHVDDPILKEEERILLDHLSELNWRIADEENFEDLNARAVAALAYLDARPEEHILLVGHGLFTRILVGRAIMGEDFSGRDCRQFIKALRVENTAITVLRERSHDAWWPWELWSWNDHAHLG